MGPATTRRVNTMSTSVRTGHQRLADGSALRVDNERGHRVGQLSTPEMKLKTQIAGSDAQVRAWADRIAAQPSRVRCRRTVTSRLETIAAELSPASIGSDTPCGRWQCARVWICTPPRRPAPQVWPEPRCHRHRDRADDMPCDVDRGNRSVLPAATRNREEPARSVITKPEPNQRRGLKPSSEMPAGLDPAPIASEQVFADHPGGGDRVENKARKSPDKSTYGSAQRSVARVRCVARCSNARAGTW